MESQSYANLYSRKEQTVSFQSDLSPGVIQKTGRRIRRKIFIFPWIARQILIQCQHLQNQEQCPHIIIRPFCIIAGAKPAVFMLPIQDSVCIFLTALFHIFPIQKSS